MIMKRQGGAVGLILSTCIIAVSISGCAMIESQDAGKVQPLGEPFSCYGVLTRFDEAIEQNGVRDNQAERISGFPYYRINRFLASFAGELSNDEAREEWLERILRLDHEARRVELSNLPKQSFPDLPVELNGKDVKSELEQCSARLMAEDLNDPERIQKLLDRAIVPDDYSSLMRVAGLYPISSWFISRGVDNLLDEARRNFQRPGAMGDGKIRWYIPGRHRPSISPEDRAAILEQARNKSALGIPEPNSEALSRLLDYYAPVWKISTNDDDDQFGRPFWQDDHNIQIDTSDPVVYRYHSFTRMEDQVLLQLNYLIWFPRRPSQSFFDLLSGLLDGLIWRVTLDNQGSVLLYDSVHPCGCYHKYYHVSPLLHPLEDPPAGEPPLIFTQDIPSSEKGRVAIHLTSKEHFVVGLSTAMEHIGDAVRYRFNEYTTLRTLPYKDSHRSMFRPDGIVMGTERAEHWFVWPMGVRSTGSMRQRGRHAIALVGRKHFDEARFLESAFTFQKND
jgi:hypothetical protein